MRDRFSAQPAREGRFAALKRLVPAESPVIVDGGAYKGEMIDIFLSQYAAPVIHAFEANPRRAAKLRRKYTGRRNVRVHERALGAFDGPVDFHILAAEPLSSAFTPKDFRETRREFETKVVQRVAVNQVRLDGILEEGADILKLDLQGYELEALKGCGGLLERVRAVACEVGFIERYEGQPLFGEVNRFLLSRGFELLDLYEPERLPDGRLARADAVYLNVRFYPSCRKRLHHSGQV